MLKAKDPAVVQKAESYLAASQQLSFTSLSVFELLYGLLAKQALRQAKEFLAFTVEHEEIVPTAEDYRLAAQIRADLRRSGREIGRVDPIIAACALNRDIELVTGNLRHYEAIWDVGFAIRLANWRV